MKQKSEAAEKLEFLAFCGKETPREIRSDNALEYKRKSFAER